MNNREYDYKELSDQVYNDVRSAISESGQKAIQDGITDIFKTNFKKNKLSLSGFGKQFKNIDKIIKDTLEDAANNKPLVIKPSILIDPQITTLNDRDLLDKIQDLYEESANASTKGEILKYAQNIIYAAKTAQIRGLDKQFPEVKQVLQTFNDPYDVYFGEFFDRIQQEMQQIEKTIVNQYIYKALEEFTKTKLSMSSPDTKKSLQTSQRQISQITTTVEDTAESVNQLEKAFKKTSQQATTATDQMVDGLKEVKTEAKETQEILEQNKKSISTKPTSYTDGDAQDSNIVSVYKNGVRTDYDVNSQRNELIQA